MHQSLLVVALIFLLPLFPHSAMANGKPRADRAEPFFREVELSKLNDPGLRKVLRTVRKDPTTKSARLVALRPTKKLRQLLGDSLKRRNQTSLKMHLAEGLTVYFAGEKRERSGKDGYRWFGSFLDVKRRSTPSSVLLGERSGHFYGDFYVGNRHFEFYSVGSGLAILREIDPGGFPPDHPPDFKKRVKARVEPARRAARAARAFDPNRTYTITVLVPYTRAAENEIKQNGHGSVGNFVRKSIDSANKVYENSGLKIRLAAVKVYRISDYTETGDWDTDRDRFFRHAGARQERLANKADVAVLLFNGRAKCGEVQQINASLDTAFAVVWWSCSIGNLSFVHEVGHLQGADHSEPNAKVPPAFAYGLGYPYRRRWRTVMVYPEHGGPRLPYFSSPNNKYNGVPMGDARHNNVRVLQETAQRVSSFQ